MADKLKIIHLEIKRHKPFIARIAVALYDEERDLIKTFICSDDETALQFYQSKLSDSQTLSDIARSRQSRVVNDHGIFEQGDKKHSKSIVKSDYASSHTTPFYSEGNFTGLIFINSYDKNVFTEIACHELSPFIQLIGLLVCKEMDLVNILYGSVATVLDISHHRDPETGSHLERMSRYARLIANELAPFHQLDGEYIEFLFRFAPLHDVGKIAIPDSILLKAGALTEEEFNVMKCHTKKGRDIMDRILNNFSLQNIKHTAMLRNIIEFHHEAVDGSGYPQGLKGDNIPLEARITAVADIFDALTSERPYKKAWSNDEALAELRRISGSKVDGNCVEALERSMPMVLEIQQQFRDDPLG
jgi:HD-GYP domain-containing protein (c-di-GMP phosphodiesterase class II)